MSEGMRRIQNEYVRWFNRKHRRDGPLFRGRFLSRRVTSLTYRRILVRYIDRNPLVAGLAGSPEQYEHGSARHYASDDGPRWLARDWVERDSIERTGATAFGWNAYRSAFVAWVRDGDCELVEQRLRRPALELDPLDDLVGAAPDVVLRWMQRKAALADGTRPGISCVPATLVSQACQQARATRGEWLSSASGGRVCNLWTVLEVGLLRDLAGLRWQELGPRSGVSPTIARRRYKMHQSLVAGDAGYARRLERVAGSLLATGGVERR